MCGPRIRAKTTWGRLAIVVCVSDGCVLVTRDARALLGALVVAPRVILHDMSRLVLWLGRDVNEGARQSGTRSFPRTLRVLAARRSTNDVETPNHG